MAEEIAHLEDVTFTYEGDVVALEELNLNIHQGEFIVVLGANGAGKTTLCYLLSGIVPHIYGGRRTGEVDISGLDPWDAPLFETARHTGVLLQDPEVQLFMPSIKTELGFGPANLGIPRTEILRRVEEALRLVRLEGLDERNPRDLSGGQKQRAALAAVLTMRPELLILDEPTSQLDPLGRMEVVQALERLKSAGDTAVLMTTHETDEILPLADRVLVLQEGRTLIQGTPAEVFSRPELLEQGGVKTPDILENYIGLCRIAGTEPQINSGKLKTISAHDLAEFAREEIKADRLWITVSEVEQDTSASRQPVEIEVNKLSYQYPGHPPVLALKDISLDIRQREFVGIIGQNGSGKSTLAKILVGLLRPTVGSVVVRGKDIRNISLGQMAKEIGLVLQNPDYQLFTISAQDEVIFGLNNIKTPLDRIDDIASEALKKVGLEDKKELFPFRLSFGDRPKLAVAATIALDPKVLILDEPTTAQDHNGRYQLADIASRFREETGRTIIMITHDMDLVAKYAERLIVMWDGKILLDGPTAEVFSQAEMLQRTFLRPPIAAQIAQELAAEGMPSRIVTSAELLNSFKGRRM